MRIYNLLVTIFWIVFSLFWLISSFSAKKNATNNSMARQGIFIRLLAIAVFITIFSQTKTLYLLKAGQNFSDLAAIKIIGVILCGSGIALAIWARVHIGKNWGMPMSVKREPELVTSGPYRFIRHPIYSGAILAMLGSALVLGTFWIIFFVFSAIYFSYSATREEKYLAQTFPAQYAAYKQRTKMLIPFVF